MEDAMTTKDEALKMAIEALETAEIQSEYDGLSNLIFKAINACKEALEQPAQEPMALKFPTMLRKMWSGGEVQEWLDKQQSLYTHPAPSWQGLSITERVNVIKSVYEKFEGCGADILEVEIARAIEKELRNKNGY